MKITKEYILKIYKSWNDRELILCNLERDRLEKHE